MANMNQNQEQLFKDLYQKYGPKVQRLCLGYTGNEVEAEDVLQEVFVKVWQNLDKFRGDAQLSTWIYRITVNTCLYHLRSVKNKRSVDLAQAPPLLDVEESNNEQQVQLLYKAISELKESDRLIISMLLEEIPYTEMAGVVIRLCKLNPLVLVLNWRQLRTRTKGEF
jgi:RNA polymerase sigma factor (sigma-70 family)